jgi:hypothetical protein
MGDATGLSDRERQHAGTDKPFPAHDHSPTNATVFDAGRSQPHLFSLYTIMHLYWMQRQSRCLAGLFAVRNAKDRIAAKARRTRGKTRRTGEGPPVNKAGFPF